MTERLPSTPSEEADRVDKVWGRIATREKQAQIVQGVIQLAMSLGMTPEQAGDIFESLDDQTANGLAYGMSGVPDGETVRLVGKSLKGNQRQP